MHRNRDYERERLIHPSVTFYWPSFINKSEKKNRFSTYFHGNFKILHIFVRGGAVSWGTALQARR